MPNGGNGGDNILVGTLSLETTLLRQKVNEANSILNSIGKNASKHIETLTDTYSKLGTTISDAAKSAAQAWKSMPADANSVELLKKVTNAYRELKLSQTEYMTAMRTGNTDQQK